jgi:hypothetical protein
VVPCNRTRLYTACKYKASRLICDTPAYPLFCMDITLGILLQVEFRDTALTGIQCLEEKHVSFTVLLSTQEDSFDLDSKI